MNWHAVVQTLIDESKQAHDFGTRFSEDDNRRALFMLQANIMLGLANALNNGLKS
jgi:hypothetical protein